MILVAVGLMFGVKLDSDVPRLLSLGSDRTLVSTPHTSWQGRILTLNVTQVEYDLTNSSDGELCLLSRNRIEQNALPSTMAWYPPLTTESFIIMANNQVLSD